MTLDAKGRIGEIMIMWDPNQIIFQYWLGKPHSILAYFRSIG